MKFRLRYTDETWGESRPVALDKLPACHTLADARAAVTRSAEDFADMLYKTGQLTSFAVEPLPFPKYVFGYSVSWTLASQGELIYSFVVTLELSKEKSDA
jgi:hypothetical protein